MVGHTGTGKNAISDIFLGAKLTGTTGVRLGINSPHKLIDVIKSIFNYILQIWTQLMSFQSQ